MYIYALDMLSRCWLRNNDVCIARSRDCRDPSDAFLARVFALISHSVARHVVSAISARNASEGP